MAFRKLLFNRVESDDGFRVKVRTFKFFVEYRESKRVARILVDRELGEVTVKVYADTKIEWKPPYTSEIISEAKRKEILNRVVAVLRFLNYSVEFVEATTN